MKIGKGCFIDSNLRAYWPGVEIGNNVLIRENCKIWDGVTIEDNVTLSAGVQLITAGHNPEDMSLVTALIVIHKGAWIATNAIILPGAEVGEGAYAAAVAVVRTEGAPFTVVAGVPAKVVKQLPKNNDKKSYERGDMSSWMTIPDAYFLQAIDHVLKKYRRVSFLFFSDEPDWVKEHFVPQLPEIEYRLMKGNAGHIDLLLCAQCDVVAASQGTMDRIASMINPESELIIPSAREDVEFPIMRYREATIFEYF